jgi:hypothetical protein
MRMGEYVTFIVRLTRAGVNDVDGVVERVGTGEKARFRGVDTLGPTIGRMLGNLIPDAGDAASRDTSRGEGASRGYSGGESELPPGLDGDT